MKHGQIVKLDLRLSPIGGVSAPWHAHHTVPDSRTLDDATAGPATVCIDLFCFENINRNSEINLKPTQYPLG